MIQPSERVAFPGSDGRELIGRIERARNAAAPWAMFAHCFTCSKDSHAAVRVSRRLAERGFNVLRFDFTGVGESEGELPEADLSANVEDLTAAADFLRDQAAAPALLVGHSLGGAAAIPAARAIAEVRALALIGAPSSGALLIDRLNLDADALARDGAAEACLGGRPFLITRTFVEDLAGRDLSEEVRALKRP